MRVVIPFCYEDFFQETQKESIWEKFHRRFRGQDLFGYQDALLDDWSFFGREQEIRSLYEDYYAGKNSGVFGLRKTGKTSALYALMRQIRVSGRYAFYFDCSAPSIYQKRWWELIGYIGERVLNECDHRRILNKSAKINRSKYSFEQTNADQTLQELLAEAADELKEQRFLFIFDEVEKITYGLSSETHWQGDRGEQDFLKFWQTIRSISQHHPNLMGYIVAGVNPKILEMRFVNHQAADNPIFTGGVNSVYLSGFSRLEIQEMVSGIAGLMGVNFSEEMYGLLWTEYGGHPFLTRQACSILVRELRKGNLSRIDGAFFQEKRKDIARELSPYIDMITDVLERYYPEEYRLLTLLASGDQDRFRREVSDPAVILHLEHYALTSVNGDNFQIKIPAVRERLQSKSRLIPESQADKKKVEELQSKHSGVLYDLSNMTGASGGYREQRRLIESDWNKWRDIFGDLSQLNIFLSTIDEFSQRDFKRFDANTEKEYFRITEDEYRKFLFAFDWLRERIDRYKNKTSEGGKEVQTSDVSSARSVIFNYGGIVVYGDPIHSNLAVGDYNRIQSDIFREISRQVEQAPGLQEREEIKDNLAAVKAAVKDGEEADAGFLEKRLRNIKNMAPAIADVFMAALISPAAGFSTVVRRVAQKVKEG
jgi:hypothetical protein